MRGSSVRRFRPSALRRAAAAVALMCVGLGTLPTIAASADVVSERWVKRYNGPGDAYDRASALEVSPDGSTIFVTGESAGRTGVGDYCTVAYDSATGERLWLRRYDGPPNRRDDAKDLGVSPDGSTIFVTGESVGSTSRLDYATVAYDAVTGARLWAARYDGGTDGRDAASALEVSPDGSRVFVTGTAASAGRRTFATLAYDAATGAELWVTRYIGPGGGHYEGASALGVSPDGTAIFVTGSSAGRTSYYDYATIAYDSATGTQMWARRYEGAGNDFDEALALGVMPDGSGVFVTGSSTGALGDQNFATVLYDSGSGAELWLRRYDGPRNATDRALALEVSPDGSRVFVTGSSAGAESGYNYATVAYATTGTELWVRRFDDPTNGFDEATALGVSPDGSTVFVAGQMESPTPDFGYGTVTYEAATGVQLWVERYDHPGYGFDAVQALAVSPDGRRVFLTGQSYSLANDYDYATVAYDVP